MSFWNTSSEESVRERAPLPRPGEAIRLHSSGDFELGVYRGTVHAIGFRRIFLEGISAVSPEIMSPVSKMPIRTPLILSFARADSLYQCETRIVGPIKTDSLAVLRPRTVSRIQRRQFYRLPLQSPTTFRVRGESGSTMPLAARLVNLSGGGALLASPKPIPGGLRVLVRVPTGKEGTLLELEADALDCRVATQGAARIYLVRLRFLGPPQITEEEREEIVAYIFEQQRMMLRNRRLMR